MTIERSILEEMVEKDSLNMKEVELFKAVDCWAYNLSNAKSKPL